MSSAWKKTREVYYWALENGDPRTDPWPLIYSPVSVIFIFIFYIVIVVAGPRIMRQWEPLRLKGLLVVYNLSVMLLSMYMFYEFLMTSLLANYSYLCQPVDYTWSELGMRLSSRGKAKDATISDDVTCLVTVTIPICLETSASSLRNRSLGNRSIWEADAPRVASRPPQRPFLQPEMANVCWWFFFSKVIELLDTVFFILRKKNEQVTFLHVYHHGTMLFNWWAGVKYVPGGQAFFIGMINSFVHIFVYLYYGLASLGPKVQPYLWWKRYLTLLQLFQFMVIAIHSAYNLFTECQFPDGFNLVVFIYILRLILLFLNFYYWTYIRKKQKKTD